MAGEFKKASKGFEPEKVRSCEKIPSCASSARSAASCPRAYSRILHVSPNTVLKDLLVLKRSFYHYDQMDCHAPKAQHGCSTKASLIEGSSTQRRIDITKASRAAPSFVGALTISSTLVCLHDKHYDQYCDGSSALLRSGLPAFTSNIMLPLSFSQFILQVADHNPHTSNVQVRIQLLRLRPRQLRLGRRGGVLCEPYHVGV